MNHEYDVVGLDIGHSAVKMTFDGEDGLQRMIFPSLACPAVEISNPIEAERSKRETVMFNGKAFFVGETARLQGLAEMPIGLHDTWLQTKEHLALLAMARKIAEEQGAKDRKRLWLLGLPVLQYARDRDRLATIAEQILPPEDRVKVMQQPDAVYINRVYTREGLPADGVNPEREAFAVIDIGYFTTDFILYESGRYIEAAAGRHDGMRHVVELIQRDLARKGIDRTIIEIENALPTRSLIDRGQTVDITAEVTRNMGYFIDKIIEEAGRVLGRRVNSLNGILVAGGGADLAHEALVKVWPHAQVARDEYFNDTRAGHSLHGPRFIISEGYYRYGKSCLVAERFAQGGR